MATGRAFILNVIEQYRNSPCLWQVSHEHYHNKVKRKESLNHLLRLFKAKDENSNLDTVKRKIASMRNCFKKELNKVKSSMKSGNGVDDVHVPKLWYYNDMLFLTDVEIPRRSSSVHSISSEVLFADNVEFQNSDNDNRSVSSSPPSSEISIDPLSRSTNSKSKRRKIQTDALLAKISKQVDVHPPLSAPRLKYTAYGEHVAEKLREMPPLMATYCQKMINDAIFMAETNNLDMSSHIVNSRLPGQTSVQLAQQGMTGMIPHEMNAQKTEPAAAQ